MKRGLTWCCLTFAWSVATVWITGTLAAVGALPKKHRYPLPPDLAQRIQAKDQLLIPTERYAQQVEKIINGELRATSKRKN